MPSDNENFLKRDLVGVKRDLVGVKRDLIGVKRDLVGVKRDLVGVKRRRPIDRRLPSDNVNFLKLYYTNYTQTIDRTKPIDRITI